MACSRPCSVDMFGLVRATLLAFLLLGCSEEPPPADSGISIDASSECANDADCDGGQVCVDGACRCPASTNFCGGACVADDVTHCGPSCEVCEAGGGTASCVGGACRVTCPDESAPCASGCCPWERVDAPIADVEGGHVPSMAIDASYGVHIAHRGRVFSGDRMRYHYFDGTSWELRATAAAPNTNWQTSLALAPDGSTRIAFGVYNMDNSVTVSIIRWTPAETTYDMLDGSGTHGTPASLIVDAAGTSHVIWQPFTSPSDSVTYSTRTEGGVWADELVSGTGDPSWSANLQLDPDGQPHVAFPAAGTAVMYAMRSGGTWVIEEVAGDPSISRVPLAIDADGVPHVAYFQEDTDDLFYAVRGAGGWIEETVDTEGEVGWEPCMALDGAGTAHIAYEDRVNGVLRYARRVAPGAWEISVIDDGPDARTPCAIAVDDRGHRHVAYRDAGFNNLVYTSLPP